MMEQSCSELALLKRCGMQEGEARGAQGAYPSAHQIQPWFNFGDSRQSIQQLHFPVLFVLW